VAQERSPRRAVIIDIDGTLAHMGERDPLDFENVGNDTLNKNVAAFIRHACRRAHIIYLTGRPESARKETERWLHKHDLLAPRVKWADVFMRADGDLRPSAVVKRELLREQITPRWNIILALEDYRPNADMLREEGIECWLVDKGDYTETWEHGPLQKFRRWFRTHRIGWALLRTAIMLGSGGAAFVGLYWIFG
jgi:sarcosine oxidase delta subunit